MRLSRAHKSRFFAVVRERALREGSWGWGEDPHPAAAPVSRCKSQDKKRLRASTPPPPPTEHIFGTGAVGKPAQGALGGLEDEPLWSAVQTWG